MAITARNRTAPWSDEELRHSIEIYLLLLRMQILGSDARAEPSAQLLVGSLLPKRNEAAIRYRMRNISFVLAGMERPTLREFSPADGVGSNVGSRIERLLRQHPYFTAISADGQRKGESARSDARHALGRLRGMIEDMVVELQRRGHNGPPELVDEGFDRDQLQLALGDIDAISHELEQPHPDLGQVASSTDSLRLLAARLVKWLGDRATKFVDAALVAAGPIVVAKAAGLLPVLIDAVEATSRWIGR